MKRLLLSLALLHSGAFAQTTVVGNGLTYSNGNVSIGTTCPVGSTSTLCALAVVTGARGGTGNQLVTPGDSLTLDTGVPYTGALAPPLTYDSFAIQNMGIQGQTCATIATNIPSYLALYNNQAARNVAIVWCGTNDIAVNGTSAALTHQIYASICAALKQGGFRVIAVTMLSRTANDTQHDAYNQLIRSRWQSYADALVDLAADPNLGGDGAYANGSYFKADGTHPLDPLYQSLIAPYMAQAVNALTSGRSAVHLWAANLVTNGTFSADSNWTKGSGWTISGGTANHDSTTGTAQLYQDVSAVSNQLYAVTFTISAYTSGTIVASLAGTANTAGTGSQRTAAGTYTEFLMGDIGTNGKLSFVSNSAAFGAPFVGSIDNVTIQAVSPFAAPTAGLLCMNSAQIQYRGATACQ